MKPNLLTRLKIKFKSTVKPLVKSRVTEAAMGGVDAANIGVIFLLSLLQSLKTVAGCIAFPIAAGVSIVSAILASYHAYQDNGKNRQPLLSALVAIFTALGISATVITTFVVQGSVSIIAPILLTITLSARSLYELGAAGYYWYKYSKYHNKDPERAKTYYTAAIAHSVAFASTALTTAAVGTVIIANKSSFGAFGIAASVMGTVYAPFAAYQAYQEYLHKTIGETEVNSEIKKANHKNPELTTNAMLHSALGSPNNMINSAAIISECKIKTHAPEIGSQETPEAENTFATTETLPMRMG